MKQLQNILFSSFLVIYLITKTLRYLEVPLPEFIQNHLTDLVCIPLVLFVVKWIIQRLSANKNLTKVPIAAIIGVTLYWSVYFEFYLPKQDPRHTGDNIDVVMYMLGALVFSIVQYYRYKPIEKHAYTELSN